MHLQTRFLSLSRLDAGKVQLPFLFLPCRWSFSRFVSKSLFSEILHEISLGGLERYNLLWLCTGRQSPVSVLWFELHRQPINFGDLRTRWTLMPPKLQGYRWGVRAYVYLTHRLVRDNQIRTCIHSTIQKVNRELWYDWKRKRKEKLFVKSKIK